MKAIMVMFDSLNRRMLSTYGCRDVHTPAFDRLAQRAVTFDNCYIGSMPCMPARRELHTGRYNFLHRSWGPIEPFDDSMPEILRKNGIYTHLVSDHQHYWEDGGATYHGRYNTWEISRGQEGDLWKGQVADPDMSGYKDTKDAATKKVMKQLGAQDLNRQDAINRQFLKREEDMPQAVTFRNGLEFLKRNHEQDRWFLQIETFDPHEPFFASERFREMYPDPDYTGQEFDWPPYERVSQTAEEVEHCRKRYRALVSMCDYYLGTVLDAMDTYNLWEDTMLIVNTDHGFLLGEHGWWAKSSMPYYNEIAHIPMFIWDPRSGARGERRQSLVQNIDVAPTLLTYFGLEPTPDMLGKSLERTIASDEAVRQYALFGSHGSHINITDGNYVYMRCPETGKQMYEYTLMPMHMRSLFSAEELQDVQLSEPFSFTKNCKVLKVPVENKNPLADPVRFGTRLYNLQADPGQMTIVRDNPKKEVELTEAICVLMKENDAPKELYQVYGVNPDQPYTLADIQRQNREEKEIGVPGMDGIVADHVAFTQLRLLLGIVPVQQANQFRAVMNQELNVAGISRVTSEMVPELVSGLTLPELVKEKALKLLRQIAEDMREE